MVISHYSGVVIKYVVIKLVIKIFFRAFGAEVFKFSY